MDIQRLLIVDSSPIFAEELTRRLSGSFLIQLCTDGTGAIDVVEAYQPHVLVLDLMLPGLDGLALMERISLAPIRPKILITTKYLTGFIERIIDRIQFDYIMSKPCDYGVLATRICELSATRSRGVIAPMARSSVTDMLTALNISINHKGFDYLSQGIERFLRNPGMSMTGELYPAIARQFNAQSAAVEHDIRRAIDAAWRSGNRNVWRMYFPSGTRPTNTVFIATLCRYLRESQIRHAL